MNVEELTQTITKGKLKAYSKVYERKDSLVYQV